MGDDDARRTPSRHTVAIAGGVALALVVGILVALSAARGRGGADEPLAIDFAIARANGISSRADVPDRDYDDDAARIAPSLAAFFSRFYEQAFLVDANNVGADYGGAYASFAPEAVADARAQEQVLTLGELGPTVAAVTPLPGTIRVRILFDADGAASLAVASVFFRASATPRDGGDPRAIASGGEFFLRPDASAWRIVAFSVNRSDGALAPASEVASS